MAFREFSLHCSPYTLLPRDHHPASTLVRFLTLLVFICVTLCWHMTKYHVTRACVSHDHHECFCQHIKPLRLHKSRKLCMLHRLTCAWAEGFQTLSNPNTVLVSIWELASMRTCTKEVLVKAFQNLILQVSSSHQATSKISIPR